MKIYILFFLILNPFIEINALNQIYQNQMITIKHNFKINLKPEENYIEVQDIISFPYSIKNEIFFLNKNLIIENINPTNIHKIEETDLNKYKITDIDTNTLNAYIINSSTLTSFSIKYSGKINYGLKDIVQEYSRSFKETNGIISEEGVYLSGESYFYPTFEGKYNSFKMEINTPENYLAITQGKRIKKGKGFSVWEEINPQDEIYLISSKFKEYSIKDKNKEYYVFLQKEDNELASKYLETTKQYINFYSQLIGNYPYDKFAMIENFWDTGYGMPSFTLLGPKVIRLPFILSSSYPHEILHNWWGNGVFVDYSEGNWCEGLTVYLSDYLIKENRGKGREYRINTLQKYSDYVSKNKDFPIKKFIERHSSSQEAIGYGKSMMFFHMLRLKLGNDIFIKSLKDFYKKNKYKKATFSDLRKSFEKISQKNLKNFFEDWIEKSGAIDLKLSNVELKKEGENYTINFSLEQESENIYKNLKIPYYIAFENRINKYFLLLNSKKQTFKLKFKEEPIYIHIDPNFDIFRKLSPNETPITLSKTLGAQKPLIILPLKYENKEDISKLWNIDKENIPEIINDSEINDIPPNRSLWIIGRENKFYEIGINSLKELNASLNQKYFSISNETTDISSKTIIFTVQNPKNENNALTFIISDKKDIKTIMSKIPHYGKYSYIIFDENSNSIKSGIWEKENSPLKFTFTNNKANISIPQEKTLAEIPVKIPKKNIQKHLKYLSNEIKERFPKTQGEKKAIKYILSEIKKYNLKSFFKDYLQEFYFEDNTKKIKAKNIIAFIEGKTKKDEYIILSAHYDHLKSKNNIFYPGANDNASGVSLLIELAKYYSIKPQERSIIFAFFSAEEEGKIGSKYFLNSLEKEKITKINANINFDTIGKLGNNKILIINSSSSQKWKYILRGAGFITQMDYDIVNQNLDASDDTSFIEKGIPAIQFLSGIDLNYHKPSDTYEKIDISGIAKIGEFTIEIIDYLSGNTDFIDRPNYEKSLETKINNINIKRKVSTGLVPDFIFEGEGVRTVEIIPDSPLYKAGFKGGEIITKINGKNIKNLKEYSDELKKYNEGDKISLTYIFSGQEKEIEIILSGNK